LERLFFDLDGTLIDSAEGIMRAYAYMMDALHLPYGSYTDFRRVVGPPLHGCFLEDGIPPDRCEHALALFQEYYAHKGVLENSVYDGIPAALDLLKRRGAALYVVTGKPQLFADQILDRLGLRSYFEDVIGADMEETLHEKADLLREILRRNALTPDAQMAMIGDRSYDIVGGRAVGMRTVGVLWGIGSEKELREAGADMLISSVGALGAL